MAESIYSMIFDNQTMFLNATDAGNMPDDKAALLANDTVVSSIPLTVVAAKLTAYKAAIATHVYVLPIVVFAGLIGNTLSFLVMLKPHNRRISCCNYLAGLSVSDNLMLLNALNYWTISFKNRPATNTECNIMAWLFQAVSFTSIVLIFSMTVDRFLAIRFPFKARRLCTPYRARVAVASIAVVVPLYTLPYFFTSQLFPGRTCVAVATTNALAGAYNWVNIFLGSIVPFIGLLTMNAFIIMTVRQRTDLSESTGGAKQEKKEEKKAISQEKNEEKEEFRQEKNGEKKEISQEFEKNEMSHEQEEISHEKNIEKEALSQEKKEISQRPDDITPGADNLVFENDSSAPSIKHETNEEDNAQKTPEQTTPSQIHVNIEPEPKANQQKHQNLKTTNKSSLKLKQRKMSKKTSVKQSSDNQLTIMLLLVTFTFLLLTLPQYARYLVAVLWNYRTSPEDYANFLLLAHVSNRFYYANSACNFFLYCISGNKFRQDVKALFTSAK